ncbi:hypothetical protein [Bradyrhizobium sp. CCBAU 53421]|uniref:hypothetical protein n=1 Tax=Bradyrhizobium sp. CCBAU 53421 TaxID=1325120 RepID=UPI0035305351
MYWNDSCGPLDPVTGWAGFAALERLNSLMAKTTEELSAERLAKVERRRLAAEAGAQAIAEIERDAIAVRKNMERLRALRKIRDAEAAAQAGPAPSAPTARRTRRIKRIVR